MSDTLLILFGIIIGIVLSLLLRPKQQASPTIELTPEDRNIVSQVIHATRQQNELFLHNMELMTDHRVKVITASFDRAMAYNNVIVTLGYAALFATLNFTKDNLRYDVFVAANILASISVILFVGFTIYSMLFNLKVVFAQIDTLKAVSLEDFYVRDSRYERWRIGTLEKYFQIWRVIFWTAVITGFTASGICIFFNVWGLFK